MNVFRYSSWKGPPSDDDGADPSHAPQSADAALAATTQPVGGAEARADEASSTTAQKEIIIQRLEEQRRNVEMEKQRIEKVIADLRNGTNSDEAKEILQSLLGANAAHHTSVTACDSDVNSAGSNLSDNRLPVDHPTDDVEEYVVVHNSMEIPDDLTWSDSTVLKAMPELIERRNSSELLQQLADKENQIRELKRQLDMETDKRKQCDLEIQKQAEQMKKLQFELNFAASNRVSEIRLRQATVDELQHKINKQERSLKEKNQRLRETDQQIAELEAVCTQQAEMLDAYPILMEQIREHEAAFREEHFDLVKVNKDRDKFERYSRIYQTERDRALQRALEAEHKISQQNRSRSPLTDQFHQSINESAQSSRSQRQPAERNFAAIVWPYDSSAYDLLQYTQQPAVTRANPPMGRESIALQGGPIAKPQSPKHQPAPTGEEALRDSLLGATGGAPRMSEWADEDEMDEVPWWFSSSAPELNGACNRMQHSATEGLSVSGAAVREQWGMTLSGTAVKTMEEKDVTWKCTACGHRNQQLRRSCAKCGTVDALQTHRLS
jgi:ribosomal protein L37E